MKRSLVIITVALALVAGGVTGWFVADSRHAGVAVTYVVGVTPTTTVTTSQLVHGTWATLPTAPISGRYGEAAVWTGHDMFIWGGTPGNGPLLSDGATYDPAARSWSLLPNSPLGSRYQPATVMAGSEVFIWGGHGATVDTGLHDGATFDPRTRTWQRLPEGPQDRYGWSQALWTGTKVILLTGPVYSSTRGSRAVIQTHSWDPTTRAWATLPSLTLPAHQTIEMTTAVSTGAQIWVWPHWDHVTPTGPNSTETSSGVSTYVYDAASAAWSAKAVVGQQSGTMTNPLWTGRSILIPTRTYWCGMCIGGLRFPQPGLSIDPATRRVQSIPVVYKTPQGSPPDTHQDFLWTGRDLLAYNSTAETSGGAFGVHRAGEAAVWDPATDAWQTLPRAPAAATEGASVWTGTRLLIWGGTGRGEAALEFVPQS